MKIQRIKLHSICFTPNEITYAFDVFVMKREYIIYFQSLFWFRLYTVRLDKDTGTVAKYRFREL